MSDTKDTKKIGITGIILMVFSVIFGFGNPAVAYLKMGYASIIWYIFGAFTFFLPLMFVSAEFAVSFKNESSGGIYTWMRKSRGELYGFVGSFMYYFAIVVWMVGVSARIWPPISSFVFGKDVTKSWSILGLGNTQTIGLLGMLLIVAITYFASRGFNKVSTIARIGGISCSVINILLYVTSFTILILNRGFFEEPIKGAYSFLKTPNPAYEQPIVLIGFITFAIFAYGGIESLGSLVDKAKSAKTFSKACILSTVFIATGYCTAILLWGVSSNYTQLTSSEGVTVGNITYVLMNNLGTKLGLALGMGAQQAAGMGAMFMRIMGLSMLLCFCGALFTLIYSPLKTLLDGAPKNMWPKAMTMKNKYDMPQNAMWMQAAVVCVLIISTSFVGKDAKALFDVLQLLSNVGQCLPYLFIIASFPAFRRKDELNHEYKIFKTNFSVDIVCLISFLVILFGTISTIFQPVLAKEENGVFQTCWMLLAPVIFISIAFIIFYFYKKREAESNV